MDQSDPDEETKSVTHQPSPTEFDQFLTWACQALQATMQPLLITKILQDEYVSVHGQSSAKSKKRKNAVSKMDKDEKEESFGLPLIPVSKEEPCLQILAFYDSSDNLIKLQFDRNPSLPQMIFKIIGLIIQFQCLLQAITIKGGLNKECLYEVSRFLPYSKLTELCLDDSFIEEANYHILLEVPSSLNYLSLARCSINDAVVEEIAATLSYPTTASKTLSILNLSSNKITDLGARYLSEILRSNRQLSYLNLSGNMLTDTGAEHLLNSLMKFPLSFGELLASKSRQITYLKQRNEMIIQITKDLRTEDVKRTPKRKPLGTSKANPSPRKKGLEKESSTKLLVDTKMSASEEAAMLEDLGEFSDPFDKENIFVIDGAVYSKGNNSLAYLSLAYNNLGYFTLKNLLKVLMYQKDLGRKPRGLINVSIEGNPMPTACVELFRIDDLLDTGLMVQNRRSSAVRKRVPQKMLA